jgi:hypothetical protein
MSTIQRVNFEPISDLLKTQIRDYALADKTIADPLNAAAFVDGEWFILDATMKAARACAINAQGNFPTQTSYPIFAERGRSDVLASSGRKVPLIVMGQWEADTRIFDAALVVSGGAAITTVGQPLKVASITIGGKIVCGIVGAAAGDGEPIVGRVSRLPATNGGKLRMFGGVSSI